MRHYHAPLATAVEEDFFHCILSKVEFPRQMLNQLLPLLCFRGGCCQPFHLAGVQSWRILNWVVQTQPILLD